MPFGLDLKSIILGIIFAYYVLPRLVGMVNRPKGTVTA